MSRTIEAVYGLQATLINIPPGGSFLLATEAYLGQTYLKIMSGSSVAIVSGATLGIATGYLVPATDFLISGPASIRLASGSGATGAVMALRMFTEGWPGVPRI